MAIPSWYVIFRLCIIVSPRWPHTLFFFNRIGCHWNSKSNIGTKTPSSCKCTATTSYQRVGSSPLQRPNLGKTVNTVVNNTSMFFIESNSVKKILKFNVAIVLPIALKLVQRVSQPHARRQVKAINTTTIWHHTLTICLLVMQYSTIVALREFVKNPGAFFRSLEQLNAVDLVLSRLTDLLAVLGPATGKSLLFMLPAFSEKH